MAIRSDVYFLYKRDSFCRRSTIDSCFSARANVCCTCARDNFHGISYFSPQVLLDEADVSTLNVQWLRSHIGVVGQEPVLFDTTIRENIRYGNDSITEEEMIKAAKEANAHDFISKLPEVSALALFSYSNRALCPPGIIVSF